MCGSPFVIHYGISGASLRVFRFVVRVLKALHRGVEHLFGTCEVYTRMHGAALREQRAGVAEKIMLAQELIERFIIETERRAVDPHEVRALQIAVCNARAVYVDELAEVLVVFVDKVDDFCKPTFALRVAETAGLKAERTGGRREVLL